MQIRHTATRITNVDTHTHNNDSAASEGSDTTTLHEDLDVS
jgi:hypothetical protein